MNGIGRILFGLFTRHVGTKFLALLLSFILLFVVQQSLEERRDLRDLKIKFQLSQDLKGDFVILSDTIRLNDVRIEGLKANVSEVMSELTRRSREVVLEINQSFLDRYPNRANIPVNREFFEAHNIPGEGVRMTQELPGDLVLSVQRLENYTLTVVPAPGQEDKLLLPPEHPYQGTLDGGRRLDVTFEPRLVEVRCPPTVLLGEEHDKLQVEIRNLAEWLSTMTPEAGTVQSVPVASIDWEASGFRTDGLPFVTVVTPRNVRPAMLANELRARFEVEERWVTKAIDLAIVVLEPIGRVRPREAEYVGVLVAVDFKEQWLDPESGGRALGFVVEVPRTLANDAARLSDLYLELDWVTALDGLAEDTASIYVPLRLRVRGGKDPKILDRVRIARSENSAPGDQPRLRFDLR